MVYTVSASQVLGSILIPSSVVYVGLDLWGEIKRHQLQVTDMYVSCRQHSPGSVLQVSCLKSLTLLLEYFQQIKMIECLGLNALLKNFSVK